MATINSESENRLPLTTGFQDLVAAASGTTRSISVHEAAERLEDEEAVFVDVRDGPELEREGKIPGAIHASRGMLEFRVDPTSPFHLSHFVPGKEFILYCSMGGRSALSAQTLQEMGVDKVAHIEGGFAAWKEAGGMVEEV